MSDNFYEMQAELIKIERKLIKMSDKYKEYKKEFSDMVAYIEGIRIKTESVTK